MWSRGWVAVLNLVQCATVHSFALFPRRGILLPHGSARKQERGMRLNRLLRADSDVDDFWFDDWDKSDSRRSSDSTRGEWSDLGLGEYDDDAPISARWERWGRCDVLPPPPNPAQPLPLGVVHFIGGAVLGATPHLSYDGLSRLLAQRGFLVVATPLTVIPPSVSRDPSNQRRRRRRKSGRGSDRGPSSRFSFQEEEDEDDDFAAENDDDDDDDEGAAPPQLPSFINPLAGVWDHRLLARHCVLDFKDAWCGNGDGVVTRYGPQVASSLKVFSVGHSLGCKLQLLISSDDEFKSLWIRSGNNNRKEEEVETRGRMASVVPPTPLPSASVLLAYNNFGSAQSVPLLRELREVSRGVGLWARGATQGDFGMSEQEARAARAKEFVSSSSASAWSSSSDGDGGGGGGGSVNSNSRNEKGKKAGEVIEEEAKGGDGKARNEFFVREETRRGGSMISDDELFGGDSFQEEGNGDEEVDTFEDDDNDGDKEFENEWDLDGDGDDDDGGDDGDFSSWKNSRSRRRRRKRRKRLPSVSAAVSRVSTRVRSFAATATKSVVKSVAATVGSALEVEFSPSPRQLEKCVVEGYQVPNTLLVQFDTDTLDQTQRLVELLSARQRRHHHQHRNQQQTEHQQTDQQGSGSSVAAQDPAAPFTPPFSSTFPVSEQQQQADGDGQQQQTWKVQILAGDHGTPNDLNPGGGRGGGETGDDDDDDDFVAVEVQELADTVSDYLTDFALWD